MKQLITTMEGIGDNIYTRPLIKQLLADGHKVWLKTTIPEVYADLDVKFCDVKPTFRTQAKNWERSKVKPTKAPADAKELSLFYPYTEFMAHGVMGMLETVCGYEAGSLDLTFDLPEELTAHGLELPTNKRIAVVKANTVRDEWPVPARNCDEHYLHRYAQYLRKAGWYVISVADADASENLIGTPPDADLQLHKGELTIAQLLSLISDADLAISSPGMFIPAAVSAGTPLLVVWGGRGMYDCPERLFDPRMNLDLVAHALPDKFCRCRQRLHSCDKRISDYMSKLVDPLVRWNLLP